MPQKKLYGSMVVVMLLVQACILATAFADVTAEPAVLVFHSTSQSEMVVLGVDGETIPAQSLTAWQFLVDRSNYSHMLRVTPTDEGLRIQPSETAEVGSYTLVLATQKGDAAVQVFMPLTDHKSSLESLAQRMKISMEDLRKQTGMSQRLGRDQITLSLQPVYYLGQRIAVDMPGAENRMSVWKVNGDTTQEGTDAHRFEFVPKETGPLLVSYEEQEGDAIVATAAALTEIAREPAILHEVKSGVRVSFQAVPGFAEYIWSIDGVEAGRGAIFEHSFNAAGPFLVELKAANPVAPGPYAFREVRYSVTVSAN